VSVGRAVWSRLGTREQCSKLYASSQAGKADLGSRRRLHALKSRGAGLLLLENAQRFHYSVDALRRVSHACAQIECATQQALLLPWSSASPKPHPLRARHLAIILQSYFFRRCEHCRHGHGHGHGHGRQCLQRQQMAAQHAPSAPVPPWCQCHLHCLCWSTGCAGSQCLDCNGELRAVSMLPVVFVQRCALTPSFCETASATRDSLSWFVQSTHPNLVMVSPTLRPAVSAGLLATTLLTLAKGASRAAGAASKADCARLAPSGSLCACSAMRA
jgi:hypothetical protein